MSTKPKKEIDWQRLAAILFCGLFAAGLVFLIGKYVFAAVLPFLIAWGTALFIRSIAKPVARKTKLPQKLCAVVLLLLTFLFVGLLLTLTVNRLLGESARLLDKLSGESDRIGKYLASLSEHFGNLSEKIPILRDLSDLEGLEALKGYFDGMLADIGKNLTSAITTRIPTLIGNIVGALPSFLLFFIITVIASFYFTLDLDTIHAFCLSILPNTASSRIPDMQKGFHDFLTRYLRAYALILFLTFCELFVGFSILSLEYSFLPALLIAFVDIFPVLGVGTVLIPWAVITLLSGNYFLGFGLLILWAAVTVIRQIIEPRIVGGTLGIHPVLMLIGMYVGLRFFGLPGMILSPAAIILARFFLREIKERNSEKEKM